MMQPCLRIDLSPPEGRTVDILAAGDFALPRGGLDGASATGLSEPVFHGGNEYYPLPSPRMQSWYRFLVDCGAQAVLGDHPHTVQGTEVYAESPIVYSLGNLLLPLALGCATRCAVRRIRKC